MLHGSSQDGNQFSNENDKQMWDYPAFGQAPFDICRLESWHLTPVPVAGEAVRKRRAVLRTRSGMVRPNWVGAQHCWVQQKIGGPDLS